MRVPRGMTLSEIQGAIQDIHSVIRPLQSVNPNLHGRRFQGGGSSVSHLDFVTKAELDELVSQAIDDKLQGALSLRVAEHAVQHEDGGLDEVDATGLIGTISGFSSTRIDGGAAGTHTVTGIVTTDYLVAVIHVNTGNVYTSEFTISGANEIDNTGGTDTTGDFLIVIWADVVAS